MSARSEHIVLAFILTLPCLGQKPTISAPEASASYDQINPGVVITEIEKGSDAEKVDIRPGDLILNWSRGEMHGSIASPFDLIWVDKEQRPRGVVTLEGFRGKTRMRWTLGRKLWNLGTRPNFSRKALRLFRLTSSRVKQGRFSEAVQIWRNSVNVGLPSWFSSWLSLYQAKILFKANRTKTAVYLSGLAIRQAPGHDRVIHAVALSLVVLSSHTASSWEPLKSYFQNSPGMKDQGLVDAWICSLMAQGAMYEGNLFRAEQLFTRSVAITKNLAPDSDDLSFRLEALAFALQQRDDMANAARYYEEALRLSERNGCISQVPVLKFRLSVVTLKLGEILRAEQYARESLALMTPGVPYRIAITAENLVVLGIIEEQRGEVDAAEHYFNKALAIRRTDFSYPPDPDIAVILGNLGTIAEDKHLYRKAFNYYRRALRIHRKYSDAINVRIELGNLGQVERKLGWVTIAERDLEEALGNEDERKSKTELTALTLYELGELELDRGNVRKAQSNLEQALRILKEIKMESSPKVECLMALARAARVRGQVEQAEAYFTQGFAALENQTFQIGDSTEIHLAFRGKYAEYYSEYIDFLVQDGQPEKAFSFIERSHARTLLESLFLAHVEFTKGADPVLVERRQDLRNKFKAQSDRRLQLMSQGRDEELKKVDDRIAELVAEYNDAEGRLRSASPGYVAARQPQPLSAAEIQHQLLEADLLLLEFSLGRKRSYVFAVTPTSLQVFPLPSRALIEASARTLYGQLVHRPINARNAKASPANSSKFPEYLETASALSRILFGPVAPCLKQKRILIVADGALQYIPFAMLPEPNAMRGARQVPLIVNHEIVNLPSASVLGVLRNQQKGRAAPAEAVAVLADPVFDKHDPRVAVVADTPQNPKLQAVSLTPSEKKPAAAALPSPATDSLTRSAVDVGLSRAGKAFLPRLRYSRQEAQSIAAVSPKDQSFVAMDFDATRAAAMSPELSQYRIVHFATHGLLDSQHPELSGLVFSLVDKQGNPQDGFLTLQDIYNLNLPADLVVLSGCETGLGKEISGEGLVGLTRGFMYAGATRVIASLWKVSDAATAKLMAELYRGIETEGMRPAEALRAAQIKMWKEKRWSAPYYWAGFQIQGEWK